MKTAYQLEAVVPALEKKTKKKIHLMVQRRLTSE
jgi:hypothetical protein